MNKSMWIAASGMEAQQLRTNNVANNIANVSTAGFKRSVAQFQDTLYETLAAPGSSSSTSDLPAGIQLGTGVRTSTVSKVFTQGTLQSSSSDLDIAIEGRGFFQVQMPDGTTAYTRSGNFHTNATGTVVTGEGWTVTGFPSIDTTATSITITSDGTVSSFVNGSNVNNGQIQLARVPNPEGMSYKGRNLYEVTEASGTAQTGTPGSSGFGGLAQHQLENSNVEIVKEMVEMIAAQRAYEMNSKSIKTADEMLRLIASLK